MSRRLSRKVSWAKAHAEKLVRAGEGAYLIIGAAAPNGLAELVAGRKLHELRDHRVAKIHGTILGENRSPGWGRQRQSSNRQRQTEPVSPQPTIGYASDCEPKGDTTGLQTWGRCSCWLAVAASAS
jgi:hypothetical protein